MTEADGGRPEGGQQAAFDRPRRRWVALAPLVIFGIIAVVFVFQLRSGDVSGELESVLIGEPAPEFEMGPLAGLVAADGPIPGFSTADLIGEVTVVNVWGSWCVPCRAEHPFIEILGADDRFQVFGINQRDSTSGALGFLADYGNPYDAVGVDSRGRVSIDWGVYGVPETFLVDRNGLIRHKIIGPIDGARLEGEVMPELERLLAETPEA